MEGNWCSHANGCCLEWRKSSYSTDNNTCVEWRKSSHCNDSNCVELSTDEAVHVRDSKDPDGGHLEFSHDSWRSFIAGVKLGQFDL